MYSTAAAAATHIAYLDVSGPINGASYPETSFGICTSIIYLYPPIYFAPVISSHSGNEFQINPSLASWMPRTLTKSF